MTVTITVYTLGVIIVVLFAIMLFLAGYVVGYLIGWTQKRRETPEPFEFEKKQP